MIREETFRSFRFLLRFTTAQQHNLSSRPSCPLTSLLGLDLPEVELELLSLKDVSVGAAALAGARGDGGEDAASLELILQSLLDLQNKFSGVSNKVDSITTLFLR